MNEEIRNDVIDVEIEKEVKVKKSIIDKAKELGNKGVDKAKSAGKWIKENPYKALEAGYWIVGGTCIAALTAAGLMSANEANKTVYSKDIGESVKLKHKLDNQEKAELDYRMKHEDKTKIEALREMGLLK